MLRRAPSPPPRRNKDLDSTRPTHITHENTRASSFVAKQEQRERRVCVVLSTTLRPPCCTSASAAAAALVRRHEECLELSF